MMNVLLCFALVVISVNLMNFNVLCEAHLSVEVHADGSYTVLVNDEPWLNSGDTFFRADRVKYCVSDGSLKLLGRPVEVFGEDNLGKWKGVTTNYSAGGKLVVADVRWYDADDSPAAAVFTQTFVDGLELTSASNANSVISGFPSFKTGVDTSVELGYFPFNGLFAGWFHGESEAGRWRKNMAHLFDGLYSGPLAIFDEFGKVLVISSFNQFMAASYEHDLATSTVNWGIMGKVNEIPPGFSYSTIIVHGSYGFNRAVMDWGAVLRRWYQRDVTDNRQTDISVNYIGYYTDNGGYYYQVSEKGMNFEDTLLQVQSYAEKNNIPYRYLQYDDWFYPVVGPTDYGATVVWDAKPSVFPHGLVYLYNKTLMPVVAHNRYWSDKTPYAKQNGGKYNFVFDGKGNALPDDQQFWDDLFANAKKWGLVTYEQDWLNYQVESIEPVHTDLTLGARWLRQMASSAERYGLTLQYCMSMPRHVLAALELKPVTQVRASTDYAWRDQITIGFTSLLLHAIGLAPFKDNFWSLRDQPGNRYNMTESNPRMQAVVALLSTGPVGVSDRIGYTDADLIKRLATSSGLLLQPSRPATAIDAQAIQAAFRGNRGPKGELWTTECVIGRHLFGIIFALELKEPYKLTVDQTGWMPMFHSGIVYTSKYFMSPWQPPAVFDINRPLTLSNCSSYDSMCLYYTSSVFSLSYPDRTRHLYLAGEMDKAVPMSPKRVKSISSTQFEISVVLEGTPGEVVNFDVCDVVSDGTISCKTIQCTMSGFGKATLSVSSGLCK